jgi:protein-disulfide isomerase
LKTTHDDHEEIPDLVVPVSSADHSIGDAAARITLLEYGDYECPDCLNAQPIVSALRERSGTNLRVIFRHFPQSSVHPRASAAAAAAEAAARQGRFWEMHEELFRHQRELAELDLTHLALLIGLEVYRFQSDLESEASAARVRSDYTGGVLSGVKGTPTFFINGRRYGGEVTLDALHAAMAKES